MNRPFWLKVIRDMRRAWAQNLALVVIATLGVASLVAQVGGYRDLNNSYQRTYDELAFADVVLRVEEAPAAVVDEVAAVAGVTGVTGRFILDAGFQLPDDDQVRSRLIGIPAGDQPAVNQLLIDDGVYLPDAGRVALLESNFAAARNIRVGDTIRPIVGGKELPLEVAGIGYTPEYLIVSPSKQEIFPVPDTFAVIFVPLETLWEVTGRFDTINDIAVLVEPTADRDAVIDELQVMLEPHGLESTTPREENPSNAALQQDINAFEEMAVLMPTLILIVAAISVYVMLGRMVRGQQPLIGLMKALGYSDRQVLRHYLAYAWVIGAVGFLLGMALGVWLASFFANAYARELGIPLVETQFHADLPLLALGLTVILFTAAGYGPARSSARLAPAAAMRLDPNVANNVHGVTLVERLIRLPFWWRLPLRNVFRQRRRTATTGLGVIFAFILILMVWGIIDSMNFFLERNFEEVQQWDTMALFQTPQMAGTLERVRGWEGVETVEPIIQLPATITVDGRSEDVQLTAFRPEQQMHRLLLEDELTPTEALEEGQVVLTTAMAEVLQVGVGDGVTVRTALGEREMMVGGLVEELISSVIYTHINEVTRSTPLAESVFNGLYLQVDSHRRDAVEEALYQLPGVAAVQQEQQIRESIEELMGLFYLFTSFMLFFALAMSFALIFNAMTVNVLERQRELATMRAIGTGGARVMRQLMAENVILWLLVLFPGLILGYWMAQQIGDTFSAEFFSFEIVINPLSYAITALGILLTMLLATWPAARRINHLNLAEATKVLT